VARFGDPRSIGGYAQLVGAIEWAVCEVNSELREKEMTAANMSRLNAQAERIRVAMKRSGATSDNADRVLTSFEGNLAKMEAFTSGVSKQDAQLQSTLAQMGNFNFDLGEDGGGSGGSPPAVKPDQNGVTVNPDAQK
jgi:hypothetical protein